MKFDKIFDYFPPPKFFDLPFAGIGISDTAIRCISFYRKSGKLFIGKYGERKLSPGVIVSGQINDKSVLTRELEGLKKELKLNYVKVSLPEERAYLFTAKIPIIKKDEIKSAVESKMEENVPVSPLELTFDFKLFDHWQRQHLDVVVSAFPISVVDSYADVVIAAGLKPLSLEIESQAAIRSLLPPDFLDTALIINFGQERVGLYVTTYKVVRFTSTIPMKGENSNNPSFLLQEIKKLYAYWHTLKENLDKQERKISRIIVCGENFDQNILSYLSSHLDTPAELGNVWRNVLDINTSVPDISFSDSLKYAVAVGLALPQDILI